MRLGASLLPISQRCHGNIQQFCKFGLCQVKTCPDIFDGETEESSAVSFYGAFSASMAFISRVPCNRFSKSLRFISFVLNQFDQHL